LVAFIEQESYLFKDKARILPLEELFGHDLKGTLGMYGVFWWPKYLENGWENRKSDEILPPKPQ